MEIRELLNEYDFPGDDIPVIKGSALLALEALTAGKNAMEAPECKCIFELMDAVETPTFRNPERDTDKPFLMPVEDVFSITGPRHGGDGPCGARHGGRSAIRLRSLV